MNDGWFYVSLLCLMGVLFNHTLLPAVVPTPWIEARVFWQVVFASDAFLFVGALAGFGAALLLAPPRQEAHRGSGDDTSQDADSGSGYPV